MSRLWVIAAGLVVVVLAIALSREVNQPDGSDQSNAKNFEIIRDYEQEEKRWEEALTVIRNGTGPEEEKLERFDELVEQRPDVEAAIAAAKAVLAAEPSTDDALEAARFLIEKTSGSKERSDAMLTGMRALAQYDATYAEWPKTLLMADIFTPPGVWAELDLFFEQFDQHVENQPVAQATARYYAATRRMTLANWVRDSSDDRVVHRDKAKQFAQGLSRGVEDEELMRRQPPGEDGQPLPYPTFAEAEKEVLFLLNALTVGGELPNTVGLTVDGGQDELLNYRGKTVLLDFWATWCAPCIEALPKLVELKHELPEQAFEIVSINTDASLQTLLDFQQQEPMPWVHWYAGEDAPLLREWAIRGFPTYMLVDPRGTLLAKQYVLNDSLLELVRATSCRDGTAC